MPWGRLLILLVSLPLLQGCLGEDKRFLEWAKSDAEKYYEDVLRADYGARFAKTLSEQTGALLAELAQAESALARAESRISEAEHQGDSEENGTEGGDTSLQALRSRYSKAFDRMITSAADLDQAAGAARDAGSRLSFLESICESYGQTYTIPPTDMASVISSIDGREFELYLAVTASFGAGGVTFGPDSQGMGTHMVQQLGDALTRFFDWLFAHVVDQDALEALSKAQKIAQEKLPSLERRKEIAREVCGSVAAMVPENDAGAMSFLQMASVIRANLDAFHEWQDYLTRVSVLEVSGLYFELAAKTLEESPYGFEEMDRALKAAWVVYLDYDAAYRVLDLARELYVRTRLAAIEKKCADARGLVAAFDSKLSLFDPTRIDGQGDELARRLAEKHAYWSERMSALRQSVTGKKCGL